MFLVNTTPLVGLTRFVLFHFTQLTLPRPLHRDWLSVALLTTTRDVTVENFRKFDGRYNDLVQYYNTPLSQFFVWPSPLFTVDMCYISRTWPHRIWLVILLIPRRMRGNNMRSLLFPGTYSDTWVFPECSCCLGCSIFIPGFVMIMDYCYLINVWRAVISFLIPYLCSW